ncbi:hypothetical protein HY988_06895 [Candidatus Micrarchaeota archaeon]|nr:hypothetical protein [Candidatus Micrarchaeota archaeon]
MEWILLSATDFFGSSGASWLGSWGPLAILAVILAILLHTVLLMFARAFSIKELEAYAMSEMLQAGASAIMVIFLVFMVSNAMNTIVGDKNTNGLITGSVTCGAGTKTIERNQPTMDQTFDAIRCKIHDRALTLGSIQNVIRNTAAVDFNIFNLGLSVFGITFFKGDWVPSLYQSTEITRIVNNLATTMLIALDAQSVLLLYLKTNMLTVFIPVGILLRSFYFTRGPGALILSIGIGMYFVFPILFILLDPGFVPAPPPPNVFPSPTPPLCYPTMSNSISIIQSVQAAGVGSTAPINLQTMRNDLSKAYVSLILHPLVSLMLTLVFVRYLMTILGGDSYDIMKMVAKVV